MYGSLPVKLGRLTADLLRHPGYIPRCLSQHPLKGKTPLDLETPWFSYAAIDFLNTFLTREMEAFEYGSGGSTIFLARRIQFLSSVEDNPEWFERVCQRLNQKKITNVNIQLHPFDFKNPIGFEDSAYLQALSKQSFDVIVIDGSEEWIQVRPICFRYAEKCIRPGGIIVVDDSWRYPSLRTTHSAKKLQIFQSIGPCRLGVTSTDIFFY